MEITDDAHLRLLSEEDAGELHGLIEANRTHLADWLPWASGQTFEDTLGFIRGTRSQARENEGFQAAIATEKGIVGVVGYVGLDWGNRSTRIGYWLDEGQQGRGTMTAAVGLLVDHALRAWELNRIEIIVATENHRSRAIPERLGFCSEGTLRQYQLVGGRYLDCISYSILAAEWRPDKSMAAALSK
jgi:ribosomal-protein-serine acetyltransferase